MVREKKKVSLTSKNNLQKILISTLVREVRGVLQKIGIASNWLTRVLFYPMCIFKCVFILSCCRIYIDYGFH